MYKDIPFDIDTHPNIFAGHVYALDISTGKIPSSKYTYGACKRYLRDLKNDKANFYFNPDYAERYLRLVQKFEHTIGHWPTKNIVYDPWQKFVWMNIMGFFDRDTNLRRFRIAHVEVARGNGKSAMASQCSLFFLALDNPNGNMIANVATRKEQARIVLDSSRAMATKAKAFLKDTGVEVLAHAVVHKKTNSIIRALSSDKNGLDGLNDVLAVCDELHVMSREVFDVIYSGMSKRKDSLTLCITTAGFNTDSVGFSQSVYARKVCEGKITDEQFFAIIYCAEEGDDLFSETTWIKANPGLGTSVDKKTFAAKASKARSEPQDLPNFKVKHLNIWLSEMNSFFDVDMLKRGADTTLELENFKGKKCRIGVDVASHIDLSSIGIVFRENDQWDIFDKSYIPEATVEKVNSDIYRECIGKGYLTATPGEAIDQDSIEAELTSLTKLFKVMDINLDPWNTVALMQRLQKKRIPTNEFRMTVANLSEPMKVLDAAIRKGQVRYNGSPLLNWSFGNVVAKRDAADNVFPRKTNDKLKIDPVIAILMAVASWIQDEQKESIYESKPFRYF